jgi:hypothetical protein
MVDRIPAHQLRAGDVLLSVGVGKTSEAIRAFDGGRYSHAALWTGESVIESTTPNVVKHALEVSLAAHPRLYVDVYRHNGLHGREAEVVAAAGRYVDRPYAYGDLALAALVIGTTAWLPTTASQESALLGACELNRFLDLGRRKEGKLVTCTELVARAYFEGGTPIHVVPEGGKRLNREAVTAFFEGLGELWREAAPKRDASDATLRWNESRSALLTHYLELAGVETAASDFVRAARVRALAAMIAGSEWGANLVTPRYLETSPDLQRMGRVHGDLDA